MASRGSKNIICTLSSSDDCLTLKSPISNVNAIAVELNKKSSTFRVSIAGAVSSSPSHSYHVSGTDPRKSKMKNILVLTVILGFFLRSVSSIQMVAHEHDSLNYKVNKTSIHSFVLIDKDKGDLKKNALERHSYNVDALRRPSRFNIVLPIADKKQLLTFEESVNRNKSFAGIMFTQDVYECTISEGSLPRTYLTSDEMMGVFLPSSFASSGIPDRFAGAHFQIIEGDEGGVFKVESKLVGDFVFLRIRTRSTAYINREQKSRYNLTIGARLKYFSKLGRISGNSQNIIPAKYALDVYDVFTNVIVTVLDSNDLGPVFDESEYLAVISDHAPLHFEIIRVMASDSDLGINSDVYYQLDNKSRSHFAIHPNLGMIMLLKHARDLESNYYELEITARDRGLQGHGRIGHTKVIVKVVPENKYAPYISVLHQTVGLHRNINAQTALAYLKISDLDLGKNGEITSVTIKGNYKEDSFELVNIDDNSSAFSEDKGAEFILLAKDSVYVERHKKELIFSIIAMDGGMPPRSSSLEIKFNLEKNFKFPTNASRMSIAVHASQFSIMKCHPIGTLIGYVNNSNNNHKMSSNSVRFKPVRCAKVANVTDTECSVNGDYSLQIKCHCRGSLTHLDQMKNAFEISGINEDVVIDFSSTFDPFEFVSVHEITGNIKISKSLRNLPTDVNKFLLLIQMESSELNDNLPSLYSVSVRIDNCNDHGPVFDEPLQDQIVVKEDVSTKTVILFAHATDEDVGNGADVIAYSILNAHVNMFANTSVGEGFDSSNDIDSILHDDPMSDNTYIFPFVIDHLSGEVFTTAPLDFDSGTRFYELYLRASDAGTPFPRHTDARPIRIIISDVNDNPPVFNLWKISCFISRNMVAGTLITLVRASDVDTVGGPITYQMTSISDDIKLNDNADTNCFSLDGISGHLILTCDLKEITRNWFHFQVVASDGLHNSSEHLIVELRVVESRMSRYDSLINKTTNVSDITCEESPKITKGGDRFFHKRKYNLKDASKKLPGHKKRMNQPPIIHAHQPFHVTENSARGTVFGKIEASDPDISYNGLLQFSILQENASDDNALLKGWELFDVDVHSGALKVAACLDRELLFGEVDDQNKETTLSDINHYLNVASDTGSLQRSENESLARSISFNIVVRVCDMAKTPLCSEKMFTIILDDVNDNHPEFDMSLYRTKVREDAGIGHSVLRIHALDRDYGINGEITYSIEGSNYFSIHPISGEIRVALNLDREFKDKHEFKVVAKDSSDNNPLSSEVAVVVVVMDVNDNKPQLLKEVFKFQILEDLPLGSVVGVIHANDPDEGNGGKILYQLLDTLGSPGENATSSHPFSIDSTSGAIILVGDLLSGHIYNIRAKVTDKGRPPLSSEEGSVRIWVVPINRNHHEPAFKDFVRECSVRENQPAGSSVVQLQAFDQDSLNSLSSPENYKVEYSIRSGTGLGYFIIDSRGIVQTSQPLDRELASSYWLTIYAQDSAISSKGSSMHLYIRVLDENDNRPLFRQPVYRFSVAENSLPRTWVGQVEASDADLPSKMGLTFHLVDKSSTFTIDKKTGVVRTMSEHLDREIKAEHRIEVLAKDNSEDKSLSSSTLIIITITDQNDCSPRFFDSPHLEILLPVLSLSDSTRHRRHHYKGHRVHRTLYEGLLSVQAYDMDSGLNGDVEYSLDVHPQDSPMYRDDDDDDLNGIGFPNISPFPLLRIDPKSGGLMVLRTLKNGERIHAQVKAKDKGEPSLHSAIKVTIRGVDIKESSGHGSLRFVDDSCGKVHILEDSPPFDMVCLAVAKYIGRHDDIGRESGHIWYYISAGNDAGNFGINWKVGSLRLLRKLERTSEHNLNLTITATDGFTVVNMMSLIHIVDSNNHDPKFENSKYHFNITLSSELNENLNKSIKIGEVKATDEDDYDDGRLFYAILAFTHSYDHNLFSIHPDSGSIFLNLEPNHNMVHGCHTFTVEAKNRPSTLRPVRQDYAHVVVCLISNDLVNRAPEFTSDRYYGEVGWWKGIGDEVLKVKAVDGGLGPNGKVRYSLVSGNEYKLFSLDSYTGSLSLFSPISQHHLIALQALLKDGFITMRVKATDFGSPKLSSYCSLQIKLSNFLESHDLKFDVHAPEFEISENVRLGSYVGHLTNTPSWIRVLYSLECVAENDYNYIERTNHVISYQLPSDDDPEKINDECMFAIDTFSGVLTTLKPLDREAKDRHILKITASSIGSQASFNSLSSSLQGEIHTVAVIKVQDENDVRPQFHHSVYNGWLTESSKPNQYVMVNVRGRRINRPLLFDVVDLDVGKNAVVGFRIVEGWASKLFEIVSSESSIKSKIPLDREAISMFQYIYEGGVDSFESDEFDNLKSSDTIMSYCAKGINIKSTKSLLLDKPTGLTVPCLNLDLPNDWPSYVQLKFHVEAFDYGVPQLTSVAEVVVEVHDINDSPPQFYGGLVDEVVIWPPLVPGFRVFRVKAFDLDFKGSELKYNFDEDAMHPLEMKYFHLDESTGWLSVTNELCNDHAFCFFKETQFLGHNNLKLRRGEESHQNSTFPLKVKVTDGRFQSSMAVVIKIIDSSFANMTKVSKDYNRFQYGDLIYNAEVLENTREKQLLTRLKILSESLTFALLNHDDLFTVHSHSGIVETKGNHTFDREAADKYDILIDVKDHLLAHVTRCLVKVTVKDVNDNPPLFFGLPYIVLVDINTAKRAVLFQPIVKDFDLGSNSELSFSLVYGNASIFMLDKSSGQILLNDLVVNLVGQKFSIIIKAEDGGTPSLSSEAEVTFYFKGDTHPYFNPPVMEISVNVDHPPFIGFAYVTANSYRGARIVYNIDDGNGSISRLHYFEVDLDSGSLVLLRDISYMMGQSISLVVRATDVKTGFHGDLRATINIIGNIREVPVFDKISYKLFITPFLQEGQVILEPNVTGSNLEFKLTQAQHKPRFSYNGHSISVDLKKMITIDPKFGLIKIGKVMDFKQLCLAGRADFTISAHDSSDSKLLTSSAVVTILPFNGASSKIYFNSKMYETKLKIPPLRSNENMPKLKSLETSLTRVSASILGNCDCIEGNNSKGLFYSLVGDTSGYLLNHNKLLRFSVDRDTGIIKAAIVSVRSSSKESMVPPIVILNVTASSSFGSVDFAHVRVKIEMETLQGPRFSSSLYFLNFNGSLSPGNIVLTTRVMDENLRNDFRMLNFEIESDDDRITDVFKIDSQGQVYIKEGFMGLQRSHFQFYIKVTDQNGFTGESKVKVDISSNYHLQKVPAFNQTAYVVNVNLGADVGATVFKIENPSTPPEALKMDDEKIRLNVLPEDCLHENGEEYFYFVDGSLSVARTLTQLGSYSFKCYMKAFNSVGQSNPVQITVNVVSNNFDAPTYGHLFWTNREPPPIRDAPNGFYDMLEFELDYYVFYVAENLETGHHIGRIGLTNSFTEGLQVLQGRIVFTLKSWSHDNNLGNINDFFTLNKNTGILTSATSFDFELTQTFDFHVVAHDSHHEMDPLEVQVRVNIINLNDNDPIFIKPEEHKVSLREDANVGVMLMKLSTMDSDHPSGPILFVKQGDPCGRFDLSSLGELTLKKALDREVVHKYKLDVVAYDGWRMTETTVEVDVLNTNDNSPICRDIPYQIILMENATIGTNILQINATDPDDDADNESSLTHVIEPMKNVEHGDNYNYDSTDLFSINRVTGIISLKGSLDRETNPKHVFWVRSSDQGGHFCRSKVEVTVKDVDDNPPRFLKLHYEGKVEENGLVGVAVMKVLAFDPDEERNALFRYYLTDHQLTSQLPSSSSSSSSLLTTFPSSSLYFSIHQQTGLVTTKMSFDREKQNLYNLTAFVISVTSHEQSEEISSVHQWSSASISITISDVNDNPPVFTSTFYSFTVLENTTVGTTIGLIKAVSIDEGLNALVTYAILNLDHEEGMEEYLDLSEYAEGSCGSKECRNGIIAVGSRTGHLTLRASLDYEKVKNYHFMVMAYDSGTPPLSSFTKVSVIVEDVNDNAPFMLQEQYQLDVYENRTVGDELMRVSALDKDSGLNAVLRFKITAGNVGQTFHMDEATGILSLQKPLDREELAFWILRIDCFDLGLPSLTGQGSIQVTVLDVNDCTPQLSANSLKGLNISEQMKPGQFLRQLVIEDCDEMPNSFPFKHEIIHVGYDAHNWVDHCRNYSNTPTGRMRTLKSVENVFFVDTQGRLYSTNKTVAYLRNIGFFMKNESRSVHEKVMILIKITDNGDISLSSCSLIPISLLAPSWKFPLGEEISIISFSLEPLKVLLNLYPKSDETRFEGDNDLTWPGGQLCQLKAIAKVVMSNSTFILNDNSEHWKEFDVRYSISRTEDDGDIKKEAYKNNIQQIFWVNEKSGSVHSMIPLDPGTYKFIAKATLKFSDDDDDDDDDDEGLIKKEHTSENSVTVIVEVLSESMLDEAVAVKFSNGIEQNASGDEDDYKNYNATLSSSSSSLVTQLALSLVDVLKQTKGLNAKILGIGFKLRDDEQSRRSKRSTVTSSSALEWAELLISATNSDHEFGHLNRTELHNTLHDIKSQLEENSGLSVVSIAFSGNSQASCDKNNDCVDKKCDITFTIDTASSVPIKLLDSSHLQIVPKFYKKVLCLCPDGERIHESGLCQSMKVNLKDYKPEKGAAPDDDDNDDDDDDDIADITSDASMTFNGQSYFAWHAAIPLERKLFISFNIKTNQTRSRLLHLAGHLDYSFLEIESGYIQFLWNFGSGPGKVRIQGQKVSDGRWHHVTLERSGLNVRLILDSSMVLDTVAIGNSDVLNLEDNKIIFGGEVNYIDNAHMDVRFGFIGCMRNIKLNGVELFLTGSSSVQGYLVNMGNIRHGCEVEMFAGVCSSRPCLNGGSCMPVDQRSFVCDCPEAFQGKLCEKPFLPHKSTNPCLSSSPNPCLNSGTCKPMNGMQYKCSCTESYHGVHCEILSSMATKEKGIADVGQERSLLPSQNFHLLHVVVVVTIVTASITVVLVVTIVCLCRMSKKKKQEETSLNSDSRKQNKLNNLIANMQLKHEDLKVDPDCNMHKSVNCRSKKQRSLNNCNNSNNHFDFFGRDLREELENDDLELEPLQGHLSPEHEDISKLSLGAEFHSNDSLSLKKNYFDGNTSKIACTQESLKESKASTFVSCRPRNSSVTNPVAFNLCQLDKRTMSENVNINQGSFDKSLIPLELKMVKDLKGLSQLSTPAKLYSGFDEKCPKFLDIFSTKQSLEWDSRDLNPKTSLHHFQSSSGLTSECGGEKLFDSTLESEQFEVLPTDELDASTDNDLPLLVKSGRAITKADPSLYQTTFISKSDDQ